MKQILNFINKYNIIYLFLILIFTLLFFNCYKYYIYSPYSDIGREFYIAAQMHDSALLYKDLLNVYAPLGYQLNSFAVSLFGDGINTFVHIGLFISLLCLLAIFLITELFTNKHMAFALTVMLLPVCAFFPSISNWITPYSYSIMYALTGFLWALYFLIEYLKDEKPNNKLIILSWLLMGFSISSKYEYSLFIFVLVAAMIYKKTNKFVWLKSFAAFCLIPFLSFFLLLCQGVKIQDFFNAFIFMIQLAKSYSVKYMYYYNGFTISADSLKNALYSTYYDFYYIFENLKRYNENNPLSGVQSNAVSFRILGYLSILSAVIFISGLFYKKIKYKYMFNNADIMLMFLFASAIVSSLKCIGSISFEIYGTYFFPILIISILAFVYNSKFLKIFNRIFVLICLSIAFFYCIDNFQNVKNENFKILNTQKGEIKIKSMFYDSTILLMNYIQENTKEGDTLLFVPEGVFINYLTNRKSDNKLFYLIPPNCEIMTDNFIEAEIKENKPDFIIFTNISYRDFGQTSFKNSWGKNIYNYIKELYNEEVVLGEDFKLFIYKISR